MHGGADQLGLSGDIETPIGRSGRQDHRVRADLVAAGQPQLHVSCAGALRDRAGRHRREQLDAEPLGLLDEAPGQLIPTDPVRESGVVIDPVRHAGLATQRGALDHHGVDALARGVDRGRETGRPATDDREVVERAARPHLQLKRARQLVVVRLKQHPAVAQHNGWDRPAAALQLLNVSPRGGVLVDIDPVVLDAVLREELLGTPAVRAPRRAIDGDLGHGQPSWLSPPTAPHVAPARRSRPAPCGR